MIFRVLTTIFVFTFPSCKTQTASQPTATQKQNTPVGDVEEIHSTEHSIDREPPSSRHRSDFAHKPNLSSTSTPTTLHTTSALSRTDTHPSTQHGTVLPPPPPKDPMSEEKAARILQATFTDHFTPLHRMSAELQKKMKTQDILETGVASKSILTTIQERFPSQDKFTYLSEGSFGATYLIYISTNEKTCEAVSNTCRPYVIKAMKEFTAENFANEIAPLHFLGNNKRLVHYYGSLKKDGVWYIVLEKAEGSLDSLLNQDIPDNHTREMIYKNVAIHLTEGLLFMHNKGLAHRDIKPANILYFKSKEPSQYDFKIADFGTTFSEKQTVANHVATQEFITPFENYCFFQFHELYPYKSQKIDYAKLDDGLNILLLGITQKDISDDSYCQTTFRGYFSGTIPEDFNHTFPLRFIKEYDPKSADLFSLGQVLLMILYKRINSHYTPSSADLDLNSYSQFYNSTDNVFYPIDGDQGILTYAKWASDKNAFPAERFKHFAALYRKIADHNPFTRGSIKDIHVGDL
jgi:serine/threonine protein kinase